MPQEKKESKIKKFISSLFTKPERKTQEKEKGKSCCCQSSFDDSCCK
ncbi:MAG: hypothetical protein WC552_02880 [Candidatus Omnitrophota bacterium]